MEKTPKGTPVGVDDPYEVVKRCDHLTDDGRCRFAIESFHRDPQFSKERSSEEFQCPIVSETPYQWQQCTHFQSRNTAHKCIRCELPEKHIHQTDERPLLEEHHLSYPDDDTPLAHEITVYLCRWCHAKVHSSWARIDDEVSPDPEAIAQFEGRHSREINEFDFETAKQRYKDEFD